MEKSFSEISTQYPLTRLIIYTVTNVQTGDSIYQIMPMLRTKKKQDQLSLKHSKCIKLFGTIVLFLKINKWMTDAHFFIAFAPRREKERHRSPEYLIDL